jgi:hypothetical protein
VDGAASNLKPQGDVEGQGGSSGGRFQAGLVLLMQIQVPLHGDGDIPGVDSVPHTGAGQDGDPEPDREWVHERDEAEARERVKSGKPRRPRASKVGLVALGRLVSEPPRGSRRSARTSRGGRSDATSASTSTRPNRMSPAMGTPVSSRAMWGVRNRRLISRSRPRSPGLRADRGFAPVLRSGTRPPRPGGLTPPRRQRL